MRVQTETRPSPGIYFARLVRREAWGRSRAPRNKTVVLAPQTANREISRVQNVLCDLHSGKMTSQSPDDLVLYVERYRYLWENLAQPRSDQKLLLRLQVSLTRKNIITNHLEAFLSDPDRCMRPEVSEIASSHLELNTLPTSAANGPHCCPPGLHQFEDFHRRDRAGLGRQYRE